VSQIKELFAFVAVDHQGNEHILYHQLVGSTKPMISDDRERLELYRLDALEAIDGSGQQLRAATFMRANPQMRMF